MVDIEGLEEVRTHLEEGAEEELLAKVGALLSSNSLDENLGGALKKINSDISTNRPSMSMP